MKKLLLLDADVVIDLHTLGLFENIRKAYSLYLTKDVISEAKYYYKDGIKENIEIDDKVTIIESVEIENVRTVLEQAREAKLLVDPGETESIAYLMQSKEGVSLCTCDKAAIKLISYMNIEQHSISLEKALKQAGQHKKLYPRHFESNFSDCVRKGKALRIQFKKLV